MSEEETNQDQGQQEESIEARFKETTEKLWEKTRKTFSSATHTAGQYGRVVQKKIDLGALHRKINAAHSDLGQLIDKGRMEENEKVLESDEVQTVFTRLDDLKQQAAELEQEIEELKDEARTSEDR
ncbi:MAG: hypothetical protein C0624_09175 [Desulfuromonas sp.]|nr:MAG: hypothetical protein C0624_09175 [Desulfuromonas sp.]